MAFELSLTYVEGILFSTLLLALPFINLVYAFWSFVMCMLISYCFASSAIYRERRFDILLYVPFYVALRYLNAWIYIEQLLRQVVLRERTLSWFQPKRVNI